VHKSKHTLSFSKRKDKHLSLNSPASLLEIPVPEKTFRNGDLNEKKKKKNNTTSLRKGISK